MGSREGRAALLEEVSAALPFSPVVPTEEDDDPAEEEEEQHAPPVALPPQQQQLAAQARAAAAATAAASGSGSGERPSSRGTPAAAGGPPWGGFVASPAVAVALAQVSLAAARDAEMDAASRSMQALHEAISASHLAEPSDAQPPSTKRPRARRGGAAPAADPASRAASMAAYAGVVCVGRWGELRAQRAEAEAALADARLALEAARAAAERAAGNVAELERALTVPSSVGDEGDEDEVVDVDDHVALAVAAHAAAAANA